LFRFTKRDPRYVPVKARAIKATVEPESGTDSPPPPGSLGESCWSPRRVTLRAQSKASAREYLVIFFMSAILLANFIPENKIGKAVSLNLFIISELWKSGKILKGLKL
jgi:hypothetical protein